MRILTTTVKPSYPAWGRVAETLPGWKENVDRNWRARTGNPVLKDLLWALRFLRARRRYDVIVTGFERAALLLALGQRIWPFGRLPHIFLDAFPSLSGPGLAGRVRRAISRQVLLSADRTVCFSEKQRCVWAQALSVPEDRFAVVPYYAAVPHPETVRRGDYVFAGGDTERDYATLVRAAAGLPYPFVISVVNQAQFAGRAIPENVRIVTTPHEEYVRLLAGAGAVAIPLRKEGIRFAGQQTYLSAMAMGKAVIVADRAADEYIRNGETGIVVEPGNAEALREAIVRLMEDPELADRIARQAREAATLFTAERYFNGILDLCREVAGC